ncbi:radical SAM protein [bacterium]|nr:MAG: radical SAM protein [bacterium]
MNVLYKTGKDDLSIVYVADFGEGKLVEFAESLQPPLPREKKWVLLLSTLFGCPVKCKFCDCTNGFRGQLSEEEIFSQIKFMINKRFPDGNVLTEKFKIQFARMGEPALNDNVIPVLKKLPGELNCTNIYPSISTIAPAGREKFFDDLLSVKKSLYNNKFQLQFSIHTTDVKKRDWLIPVKKWGFDKIAEYGNDFYNIRGRKITLNFALANGMPIDTKVLENYFSPDKFLVKITPVNPTYKAELNNIKSNEVFSRWQEIKNEIESAGYDVILSLGEPEENQIGSNCGQYVSAIKNNKIKTEAYTYNLEKL